MPSAGKKDIDPREHHFLVRGAIFFIILLGLREGAFFIFPYMVNDSASNILPLLTVTNIITIISCVLILRWLKIGFWIFLGVQILNFLLGRTAGLSIIFSLIGVISAGILWLFMRLPTSDGYSTWDYLSGNYTTIRDRETTVRSKKCRMCDTIYTFSLTSCPSCGSFLYEETAAKNKKCRMCSTVYTGSLFACPSCGSSLYGETTEEIGSREQRTEEMSNEQLEMSNEEKTDINSDDKKAEIERLEKLFDATTDENEKSLIAKQLYELGVMYYWRFMPRNN
jgi:RNA polymerase subunit RPABC4/transcription elongation factor Spt4